MKTLIGIVLSILLLLPSFGSFFVYSSFKLHQDQIIKTICVQRKMVNNTCNGRCELNKSIKKYNDNEKRMQNNLDQKTDLVFIPQTIFANYKFVALKKQFKESNFFILEKKPIAVTFPSFHPPSFFV